MYLVCNQDKSLRPDSLNHRDTIYDSADKIFPIDIYVTGSTNLLMHHQSLHDRLKTSEEYVYLQGACFVISNCLAVGITTI